MQLNNRVVSVEATQQLLRDFEMDSERRNARSAMVMLALAGLGLGDSWQNATNEMYGTRAIMDWIAEEFRVEYKPNTRETIRRFTLHQFVQGGLVEENADDPSRPTNSPKWNYRLSSGALQVIKSFGTDEYEQKLMRFKAGITTWLEIKNAERELSKVPVLLPNGEELSLSPGGQNILIKSMVEEFCPRFAPGAKVLYVGDTSKKDEVIDEEALGYLGIVMPERGKEPDLIVWMEERSWLFLMEACSTHGPVDVTRKEELTRLFGECELDMIFVSCFPTRKVMQQYLSDLAWETEAWCADAPDHMIHLDGEKFMGPYSRRGKQLI